MLLKTLNQTILLRNFILKSNLLKTSSVLFTTAKTTLTVKQIEQQAEKKNEEEIPANLAALPVVVKPSVFNRLREFFGYQGSYRYPQNTMAISSVRLYLCIQKQIDYDLFFKVCDARDVFFSFCLITFFHVWLVCVRLNEEGHSGRFARNRLIEAMWKDISERMKKLGSTIDVRIKKKSSEELADVFNACLFGLDEGLLSNDMILASCLWRHLLEMRDLKDYEMLNVLCEYVRKNVSHMETIKEVDLLKYGIVTFVPLGSDSIDHFKEREKLYKYVTVTE